MTPDLQKKAAGWTHVAALAARLAAGPPVASAPTVHFGSGRVDETAPLLISWFATDIGTGVASYEVQVSIAGGAFTNDHLARVLGPAGVRA